MKNYVPLFLTQIKKIIKMFNTNSFLFHHIGLTKILYKQFNTVFLCSCSKKFQPCYFYSIYTKKKYANTIIPSIIL